MSENNHVIIFHDSFGDEPKITPGQKLRKNPRQNKERDAAPGWVYLFALPDEWQVPLYKIGLSKNPIRRASQISKDYGTVMIAACFQTDNMARDEEYLMEQFAENQTNGTYEYFTLSFDDLVNFILLARELARDASPRLEMLKKQ